MPSDASRRPDREDGAAASTTAVPRLSFVALTVAFLGAGLILRLGPWRLPLGVHHVGGGLLWGAMLFALGAAIRPSTWGRLAVLLAVGLVVALVETSRLAHTPDLDAFRRTLAGQLLLGRVFSPRNILVDMVGATAVLVATRHLPWHLSRSVPVRRG